MRVRLASNDRTISLLASNNSAIRLLASNSSPIRPPFDSSQPAISLPSACRSAGHGLASPRLRHAPELTQPAAPSPQASRRGLGLDPSHDAISFNVHAFARWLRTGARAGREERWREQGSGRRRRGGACTPPRATQPLSPSSPSPVTSRLLRRHRTLTPEPASRSAHAACQQRLHSALNSRHPLPPSPCASLPRPLLLLAHPFLQPHSSSPLPCTSSSPRSSHHLQPRPPLTLAAVRSKHRDRSVREGSAREPRHVASRGRRACPSAPRPPAPPLPAQARDAH